MSTSVKLKEFEAENFKGIDHKLINIEGRSFIIVSKNGTNKSSLMDGMMSAIDSSYVPSVPIKQGHESGSVKVVLEEDTMGGQKREYTVKMNFTQSNQTGKLTVLDENGAKIDKSPREFLNSLLGKIPKPIHDFLRGNRQEDKNRRYKTLRTLTGKEKELDKLEVEKKEAVEEREKLHNEVKALEGGLYNHGITEEEFAKYSKPANLKAAEDALAAVQPTITKINGVREKYNGYVLELSKIENSNNDLVNKNQSNLEEIKRLEDKIQSLKAENAARDIKITENTQKQTELKDKIKSGDEWFAKNTMPNVTELTANLTEATKHDTTYKRIKEFEQKQQELFKKKQDYDAIDAKVKDFDRKKAEIISKSNLGVPGLTFDENGIYLNGLPLEEGQINTAKILEVGEDLFFASNTNLKVMFVPNGSMYDKENLHRLFKKAHAKGVMVIAEVVGDNDAPEIIWYEDYFK